MPKKKINKKNVAENVANVNVKEKENIIYEEGLFCIVDEKGKKYLVPRILSEGKRVFENGNYEQGSFAYKKTKNFISFGTRKNNIGEYYGSFLENLEHSKNGVMNYINGDVYRGAWKSGLKEGNGTMFYINGDILNVR